MTKEIRVGIGFSGDRTQIVAAEFRDDGTDLKYLDEIVRQDELPFYFLPETMVQALKPFGKIAKVGVSMEIDRAVLQTFPLDASLTTDEREEHLDWEWKNFVPEFSSGEYLRQTRMLKSNNEETHVVLSSILKHSLLNEIKASFQKSNLQCDTIELHTSTSERALRLVHPEISTKTIALLSISHLRLDVLVFESGALTMHRYAIGLEPKSAVEFLANELLDVLPETMFVFGAALSYEWIKALKSSLGVIVPLNPFRKFRVTPEVKNFSRFLGHEHRFSACVGCMLPDSGRNSK
ncbi:MAG: hypothetical protein HY960_09985 [Ignavibacteriae bacterium]|nr:hypothetical protein [Ignavibacteriota bacterium]